jgi:DNA-binding NarL/FixJ family response regulator
VRRETTATNQSGPEWLTRRESPPIVLHSVSTTNWSSDGTLAPVVVSDMRVLVIDPEPIGHRAVSPAVEAVVAVITRLGISSTIVTITESDQMLECCPKDTPDVVILALPADMRVADTVGSSTTWDAWAQIARVLHRADVTVIAVGVGSSVAAIAACVRQGAVGVLDLGDLAAQLENCGVNPRNRQYNNERTRSGHVNEVCSGSLPQPYDALVDLTPGEGRVLFFMMHGASAVEIADHLTVSPATVRTHIRSILGKLRVSSQLAAVALANGARPFAGRGTTVVGGTGDNDHCRSVTRLAPMADGPFRCRCRAPSVGPM